MNAAHFVLASIILAAASSSFAADQTAPLTASASTAPAAAMAVTQSASRTRADVIAELLAARQNGTLIETEADLDVAQTRKHVAK
jgi:hypothetical protein